MQCIAWRKLKSGDIFIFCAVLFTPLYLFNTKYTNYFIALRLKILLILGSCTCFQTDSLVFEKTPWILALTIILILTISWYFIDDTKQINMWNLSAVSKSSPHPRPVILQWKHWWRRRVVVCSAAGKDDKRGEIQPPRFESGQTKTMTVGSPCPSAGELSSGFVWTQSLYFLMWTTSFHIPLLDLFTPLGFLEAGEQSASNVWRSSRGCRQPLDPLDLCDVTLVENCITVAQTGRFIAVFLKLFHSIDYQVYATVWEKIVYFMNTFISKLKMIIQNWEPQLLFAFVCLFFNVENVRHPFVLLLTLKTVSG